MSVTKSMIEQKRTGKNVTRSGVKPGSKLFTYKPTDHDKQAIRGGQFDDGAFIRCAGSFVERGCTVTMGGRQDSDNVYCLIREGGVDWHEARCVSVWHRELSRAVAGLCYYLSEVNPEFPEGVGPLDDSQYDW